MEQKRFKFLLLLFSFVFLILLVEGVYYWRITTSTQTPSRTSTQVVPGEYVTTENLWTYVEPDEETKRGYLIPGRTFKIIEQKGEWAKIEVFQVLAGVTSCQQKASDGNI